MDSNVLVHLSNVDSQDHALTELCVELLLRRGDELVYTAQNLIEFWNVCTRPLPRGFGLSVKETHERTVRIEAIFRLLADTAAIHAVWRQLVVAYRVSGVQVHDARLAAVMAVHEVGHILTFDEDDFRRYTGVTVVHPRDIVRSSQ